MVALEEGPQDDGDAFKESFAVGNSSKSWDEVIENARAEENVEGISESQRVSLKRETEVLEGFKLQTEYKQRKFDPFLSDMVSNIFYCGDPRVCYVPKHFEIVRWLIISIGALINSISTILELFWIPLILVWAGYALFSMGPYPL